MAKIKTHISCNRVAASTILEVVVSMVIIVFILGIALMILSNVIHLSLSGKQVKANSILQQELIKITDSDHVNNEVLQVNGWRIEKSFKPCSLGTQLLEADIVVYDQNNSRIAELKSIVKYEAK